MLYNIYMKNFYLYILLLCFIIIAVSTFTHYYKYYVLREPFENSNNKTDATYILLGDSIIKNNSYVKNGKGIDDILNEKTNGNTQCYAKDESTIVDIYSQLDSIPSDLNKDSSIIFLSVGGNDILNNYANKEVSIKDTKVLDPIFNAYKTLIKSIQTKMNDSKLVLLDIYYPTNIKLAQYKPILEEWNKLIADFASTNSLKVINISNILIESSDFTLNIEPSESGGEKIVNNILLY
jgi:hypothetical protein